MTQSAVGARVARHTILSLLGFVVPLAIALVSLPVALRALGPARFGLLGLAWAITEYLGFVDMGLGRSTVRFVADSMARAPRDLRQIVAISFTTQVTAGFAAGIAVWLLAGTLAFRAFAVPQEIQAEAAAMFRIVALNGVIVIAISALRSVLEGAHRFDIATMLKIPAATVAVLIPAIGAVLGASLPTIVLLVFLARIPILLALILLLPRILPDFRWEIPREWRRLRTLLSYSGWVALSGLVQPILSSADRFLLGSLVGVAAVGFYTAPYEAATRLLLVPVAMFLALFPTLTVSEVSGDRRRTKRLMESAARQLALVLVVPVATAVVLAPELLTLWLGSDVAARAATALRILAIGVFVNGLAHVPSVFLYAAGRPDLPAKTHVLEAILHVPLTFFLVSRLGVTGAAMAWTTRVVIDAFALQMLARHVGAAREGAADVVNWLRLWVAAAILCAALILARAVIAGSLLELALVILVAGAVFAAASWRWVLTETERSSWSRALGRAAVIGPGSIP